MGKINKEAVMCAVHDFLLAIGEDPQRPGLKETPKRVAKMVEETLEGVNYSNEEIAAMFKKGFDADTNALVVENDIPVFSYCEHHLALMYDMNVSIAYLPHGTVLGLSKLARIADMCAKRLQLQERLGEDIAECVQLATDTEDVMVLIEGKHACMTSRGIKRRESVTRTATVKGEFVTDVELRKEAYRLMGK